MRREVLYMQTDLSRVRTVYLTSNWRMVKRENTSAKKFRENFFIKYRYLSASRRSQRASHPKHTSEFGLCL